MKAPNITLIIASQLGNPSDLVNQRECLPIF